MHSESPVFQTSQRIRLGVWGLGRGLHIVETAGSLNIDVVAGCDLNPHFVNLYKDRIPDGRFTDDVQEFLSLDFDAVLLATYCPDHAEHAIMCLQAGKHVLSEVTAFHSPAEGVRLVEAVEASGRIYQMAENYPYTPANRYLERKWKDGLFGELQYAEYAYLHDCLHYIYSYIDGSPIQPGHTVHSWRAWLPWHYYCTHSLGPVMNITGRRPVRVVSLPSGQKIPGHLMGPKSGLAGVAPSLIEMDNGAIVRNLMGGTTNDRCENTLYGTRGSSMILDDRLVLRLGGRGHSPSQEVQIPEADLDRRARSSGHGGADFWVLYHFSNEILNGIKGPFDIYTAADVTLPGILAYRSSIEGGKPYAIPDFRKPHDRARFRDDNELPDNYNTRTGVFNGIALPSQAHQFTECMTRLLQFGDEWQAFIEWASVFDNCTDQQAVITMGKELMGKTAEIASLLKDACALRDEARGSDGARVLGEAIARFDEGLFLREDPDKKLRSIIAELEASQREAAQLRLHAPLPQLCMRRKGFQNLPGVTLPEGYSLRHFHKGDEAHWIRIISEAFKTEMTLANFHQNMTKRPDANEGEILFVVDPNGVPCATGAAYGNTHSGYVHFLGVSRGCEGKRLGYWLSLAILHKFRERGCVDCLLHTDDFRLPAIKCYLRLGFHPALLDENHLKRWRHIADILDRPEILDHVSIEY